MKTYWTKCGKFGMAKKELVKIILGTKKRVCVENLIRQKSVIKSILAVCQFTVF